MNAAPRHPVAFDIRTVESRAPRGEFEMAVAGALNPGAFFDTFKSTGSRPRWALAPPETTRSVPHLVASAVNVRSRDIRWNDNWPVLEWAAQHYRSVTGRVAARVALRRAAAQQAALEANPAFWRRLEASLNGGLPAYEIPAAGTLAERMEALASRDAQKPIYAPNDPTFSCCWDNQT